MLFAGAPIDVLAAPPLHDLQISSQDLSRLAEQNWPITAPSSRNPVRDHPAIACRVHSIRTAWNNALDRLGMPKTLVHDLRRTAATNMNAAGIPRSDIKAIAGWKTDAMFERCRIASEKRDLAAGQVMERYLKQLGGQPEVPQRKPM